MFTSVMDELYLGRCWNKWHLCAYRITIHRSLHKW